MNNELTVLQNENTQLKARLFDALEQDKFKTQLLEAIAAKVGYEGVSPDELLAAIPVVDKVEPEEGTTEQLEE